MKTAAATSAPASEFQLWGPLVSAEEAEVESSSGRLPYCNGDVIQPKS